MAALEFLVEVHYGLAQIHYFGDAEVVTNNFYATWWVYSCGPAWRERNLVMAAGVLLLVIGVTLRLLRMRRSRTTPIEV